MRHPRRRPPSPPPRASTFVPPALPERGEGSSGPPGGHWENSAASSASLRPSSGAAMPSRECAMSARRHRGFRSGGAAGTKVAVADLSSLPLVILGRVVSFLPLRDVGSGCLACGALKHSAKLAQIRNVNFAEDVRTRSVVATYPRCQQSLADAGASLCRWLAVNCSEVLLHFDVSFVTVRDQDVRQACRTLPRLQAFLAASCGWLLDDTLHTLAVHCKDLRKCFLGTCTGLTGAAIEHLTACARLEKLYLNWNPWVTDECLNRLATAAMPLRKLFLPGCAGVSDEGVSHLGHCARFQQTLGFLALDRTSVTSQGVNHANLLGNLNTLILGPLGNDDHGVVSIDAVQSFMAAVPDCRVHIVQ